MSLLEQPLKINNLELKSRLIMPPMATAKCTPEGLVTDEVIKYYVDRADRDDISLVITEHAHVTPDGSGRAHRNMMTLGTDECIEGQARLVDAVHATGTPVCAQINHAGSSSSKEITGHELVSSSASLNPGAKPDLEKVIPRALTKDEILALEELYMLAAVRAKKAGYDAVEIHSAHGYLMDQFYSPLTNKRTDEYGPQSIENRIRFQVETYRKIRAAVGEDYPVFIRLGGCDYTEGGSTIDDAVEACHIFEKEGLDLIDISGGMCRFFRPDGNTDIYFTDMSKAVKAAIKTPVVVTGGITKKSQAEHQLETGCADLIGVGRALMNDPKWEL